jgi:dynein heavy chain 2
MQELSPPSVNLKKLYESETLPEEPILIVISPGADPSQELKELADEIVGHDRYHQVKLFIVLMLIFINVIQKSISVFETS